ncbi:MAG: ATP-binding protein [Thermoleophilia bacterium]|jgi:signal transduction histidine kinase
MKTTTDKPESDTAEFNPRVFAVLIAVAVAIGVLTLTGWVTGSRFLTSIRDEYFPMPPSTAVGLLLTGGSMMVTVLWPKNPVIRTISRLINIGLMVLATIIILEAVTEVAPGMEERLFGLKGELNGIPLGRMSPIAAVLFFLLNLALLVFHGSRRYESWCRNIAVELSLAVLLTGSVTTLGYLYGTPLLYGGDIRPVAPTAGLALALLGASLISGAGNSAWPLSYFVGDTVRARMLRSIFPIIIGLIFVDGWIESVAIVEFDINPVLVSALSATFFLALSALLIARSALKIGGAVDQANARRDRAEERMQKLNRELERSNAELEQFAYVASHDLQEPLRMVSSYMQLIEKRYSDQLDADAREFIGFAVDGSSRMQIMIRDLLVLSRVSTRGKPFTRTDSGQALDLALANLAVAIRESGADVTYDDLPELKADPTQLMQLFQNLVGNAIKFHGEEPPRIHISSVINNSEWVISISDNGIGFEEGYAEKIFVIFQRLHGRNDYEGSGLGLALCKKIVERHGGRIWAESEPGRGSVFYFTIPLKGEEDGTQHD